MFSDDVVIFADVGEGGVCGGEEVIVDRERVGVTEEFGTEIFRSFERHVALIAIGLGGGWVIERTSVVSGEAAEEEGIVVVLSA